LPTDYLSKEFHAGRRDALRKLMPDNSVFVVMAYPTRTFSNDVDYFYHQNPDMYYFSGYREPQSMLLIFKEEQKGTDGPVYKEIKAVHPGMSELEIQGLHEYVHKKYGAEEVGYGSIVGAGANGCVLHYMENTKTKIGNEMLLMDVGAEYHGYTADVTRTVPANGKFSREQKLIYNLVYEAQEAAFKILKDGAKWTDASKAARDIIAEGLLKLGIIKDKS